MKPLIERIWGLEDQGRISFAKGQQSRMHYCSTVAQTYYDIVEALHEPDTDESALTLYMNLPRLISGIIDYGLQTHDHVLQHKEHIETMATKAFQGNYDAALRRCSWLLLPQKAHTSPVVEKPDLITWRANKPAYIDNLCARLHGRHVDILVIDGHDGYRPGLAVASALDVPIFSVHNSVGSNFEHTPELLRDEHYLMEQVLHNKHVWIFGEDISTGGAVMSLQRLVQYHSKPKSIHTASCIWMPPSEHLPKGRPDCYGIRKIAY